MKIKSYKEFLIKESYTSQWNIDESLKDILSTKEINEITEIWGDLVVGADIGVSDYNSKLRNCVARLYLGEHNVKYDTSDTISKIIRYVIEYDLHLKEIDEEGNDNIIDGIKNIRQLQKLLTPLAIDTTELHEYEEKEEADVIWENFEWVIYVPFTYECAAKFGNKNWHHIKFEKDVNDEGKYLIIYNKLVPNKYSFYVEMDYKNNCELCDRFDSTLKKDRFVQCVEELNDIGFGDICAIIKKLWYNNKINLATPNREAMEKVLEDDLENYNESWENLSSIASMNEDLFLKHVDSDKFFKHFSPDLLKEFKRTINFHMNPNKEQKIKSRFIDYLSANIPIDDFKHYVNVKSVQDTSKSRVQNYTELLKDVSLEEIVKFIEKHHPTEIDDLIKNIFTDADYLDDVIGYNNSEDVKEYIIKIWGDKWTDDEELMKQLSEWFEFSSWFSEYVDTLDDKDLYYQIKDQIDRYSDDY